MGHVQVGESELSGSYSPHVELFTPYSPRSAGGRDRTPVTSWP